MGKKGEKRVPQTTEQNVNESKLRKRTEKGSTEGDVSVWFIMSVGL